MIAKNWTNSAKECYRRGCICNGCPIKEVYKIKCHMKESVIGLVKKFGIPEGLKRNNCIYD